MKLAQTILNVFKENKEKRKESILNRVRTWINHESWVTTSTVLFYRPKCLTMEVREVEEFQKEVDEMLETMGLVTVIEKGRLLIEFLPGVNMFKVLYDAKPFIDSWLWQLKDFNRIIVLRDFLYNQHPEIKQYIEEQGFIIGSEDQSKCFICLPKEE